MGSTVPAGAECEGVQECAAAVQDVDVVDEDVGSGVGAADPDVPMSSGVVLLATGTRPGTEELPMPTTVPCLWFDHGVAEQAAAC